MPSNYGRGFDYEKDSAPLWPKSTQNNPEEFVHQPQARSRSLLGQNRQLLPQSWIFEQEVVTRTDNPGKRANQNSQNPKHQP
jgi:hypothetical protein